MNVSDAGAAWNYGVDGHDDEDETGEQHAPQDFRNDAPLQYAALFAESQPSNGCVPIRKLGSILARARIPSEKSAVILEYSADTDTQLVSESNFYWALGQAALLQSDPDHTVVYDNIAATTTTTTATTTKLGELALASSDDVESSIGSGIGELEVPHYVPTADPKLHVTLTAKDAGSFLAKHSVYSIEGEFHGKTVKTLRRFRDFDALHTLLTHRYAFRAVPVLPPKRLALNGRFFVGEPQDEFLKRRACGLARFLNLLVQHPVLSRDVMVERFLFADSQFTLRKHPSGGDELEGRTASPVFISQWSANNYEEKWDQIEHTTADFIEHVTALCVVMDKQLKRIASERNDAESAGRVFIACSRNLLDLYPDQQEELPAIQERLEACSRYADMRYVQLESERTMVGEGPLRELRLYRDMLAAQSELFERLRTRGGNSIPRKQRVIAAAQKKLLALSTREDAREEDLHRLRMEVQEAQASIREQTNRDWLIKMTVAQEAQMIQSTQFQISKVVRSLAKYLAESTARHSDLATQLADTAGSAPLPI